MPHKNPEDLKNYKKKYYEKTKVKQIEKASAWNKEYKERRKVIHMNSQWRCLGMTINGSIFTYDDFNRLYIEQNGCCSICKKHQADLNKTLSVDHDHNTNEVRGLLCQRCNAILGMSLDDKTILENAIIYLEKNK